MLNDKGFNLWAEGYDVSVGLSDESNTYPFAGYKRVLNRVYQMVLEKDQPAVLDIGFGTGALTAKLYERCCEIWGQDFSQRMLELARQKMPGAHLYLGDFSNGLCEALRKRRYDAIISTYALHHLTDEQKIPFVRGLLELLNAGGQLIVGDVAFETPDELQACRAKSGSGWDDEEYYWVYSEIQKALPGLEFEKLSHCAGILSCRVP